MKKILLFLIATFSIINTMDTNKDDTSDSKMKVNSELKEIIESILKDIEKERIAEFKKMMEKN